jgi:hypothetical protein
MQPLLKWLRENWGGLGTFLANVLVALTTNWALAVSTAGGIAVWLLSGVLNFVQRPEVYWAAGTFLMLLWTFIGLSVLRDRKRPRVIKPYQDYSYGLLYEGLALGFQPDRPEAAFQIGVVLRNFSTAPLKYTITEFDIVLADYTTLPRVRDRASVIIPRGGQRVSRNKPFKLETIQGYIGRDVKADIDLVIQYGHPEKQPERQLRMKIELHFFLEAAGGVKGSADGILAETDTEIPQ